MGNADTSHIPPDPEAVRNQKVINRKRCVYHLGESSRLSPKHSRDPRTKTGAWGLTCACILIRWVGGALSGAIGGAVDGFYERLAVG